MSGGSSECTGCEGAWPSAVPVCLRSLRDDTLPEAVQPAAARATAKEAAPASVPAMWTGAAMSRGLGVTRSVLAGVAMRRLQRAARRLANAKSSRWQSRAFRTNRLPALLRPTLARGCVRGTCRVWPRTIWPWWGSARTEVSRTCRGSPLREQAQSNSRSREDE
jgi:hypothetical protein